jgi:hypothetical protein
MPAEIPVTSCPGSALGLERLGELLGHEQQHRPGRTVLLDRHRPASSPVRVRLPPRAGNLA